MSIQFLEVTKNLKRAGRQTLVFEKATFELPSDRVTGILAAPATGKTTLVHLTTGGLRADRGRIRRDCETSFPVGAGGAFNGQLTGRENLVFICRIYGFDPKPIISFVAEYANLGHVMDKQFRLLTTDERTRFLFSASYAMPFELYIVDDVIAGGRGNFRELCLDLVLERMKTSGFIIVSSSPRVLKTHCDNFHVLANRTIIPVADIEEATILLGSNKLKGDDGSRDEVR